VAKQVVKRLNPVIRKIHIGMMPDDFALMKDIPKNGKDSL